MRCSPQREDALPFFLRDPAVAGSRTWVTDYLRWGSRWHPCSPSKYEVQKQTGNGSHHGLKTYQGSHQPLTVKLELPAKRPL